MDDDKRRDNGMTQRRKVLGNEWVDKSIANRNAFNTDFQDLITRASIRKSGGYNVALGIALAIGSVISFASMLLASQAGEAAALRMHAAELLMMLGTVIVMLVEPPARKSAEASVTSGELSLQQT